MKMHQLLAAGVLCASIAAAQAPPKLQFEVASVKPSPDPGAGQAFVGVRINGANFSCSYYTLKDYVRVAYRVKQYQVEGPDWISSEHFDINAKLPDGSTRDQVPDMLQALLADRFKMTFHKSSKDFPVYGLLVKGGTDLKPVEPATADDGKSPLNVSAEGSANGVSVNLGNGSYFALKPDHLEIRKLTFAQMADILSRFTDMPVVDMTKLSGKFNIDMPIAEEDYRNLLIRSAQAAGIALPPQVRVPDGAGAGDSLIAGLERQGLKLEHRKAPLEVIVVDHAEKNPSAN